MPCRAVIVSEEHRYAFLQFPQAASTAIGDELVEHYDGRRILRKHSMLHHFQGWAGSEASRYFVFSSIRNPLDKVVSLYYKLKTDHKGQHSDPSHWKTNDGWVTRRQLRRFRFVQEQDADFADFFRRFYRLPYVDWSTLDHHDLDFVIRVENIQQDFARALSRIGLEQVRPLPTVNPTRDKSGRFEQEYPTSLRPYATRVMGPMMRYLGYEFPEDWPDRNTSVINRGLFHAVRALKGVYYRHFW